MDDKGGYENNHDSSSHEVTNPLSHLYLKIKSPNFVKHRIIFIGLIAWLPLLILCILNGVAFGGVQVPFIYDVEVHARLLAALPLFIYAEVISSERLQIIIQQLIDCDIIPINKQSHFKSMIALNRMATNSVIIQLGIVLFVYTIGHQISKQYLITNVTTWYTTFFEGLNHLTLPGYWYMFISLPLFQFVLLRWYFRMFLWYRFLWQISRMPLHLNSLHPDRTGGIGFLEDSLYAFQPFLLAHSVLLSGVIFNHIWNTGAVLSQFQYEIITFLILLLILPVIPLFFFMVLLVKTKRYGTLAYNIVASKYVNDFSKKWVNKDLKNPDELLGTSDIQSLADLTNSFNVTADMRIIPFGRRSIISTIILISLPLLPLLFTIIPIDKLILKVISVIF